jgi:hypothetical protein
MRAPADLWRELSAVLFNSTLLGVDKESPSTKDVIQPRTANLAQQMRDGQESGPKDYNLDGGLAGTKRRLNLDVDFVRSLTENGSEQSR